MTDQERDDLEYQVVQSLDDGSLLETPVCSPAAGLYWIREYEDPGAVAVGIEWRYPGGQWLEWFDKEGRHAAAILDEDELADEMAAARSQGYAG